MAYTTLRYEKTGRIGVLTFATPARLNAITEARLDEMEAVLAAVDQDEDIGALILTGDGDRAFCVGLDLDLLERAFADLAYFERSVRRVAAIISRIEALSVPTIAAINGVARAGGFEFALGCDFIVVGDQARIGDAHTDSGVLPAAVALRLKRKVGDQKAKALIWSSRYLKGQEAVDYGLAFACFPQADLLAGARDLAGTFIDKPKAVIAASKSIFQKGSQLGVEDGAELELQVFARYMGSEPYGREGYTAFREGRPPSWKVAG